MSHFLFKILNRNFIQIQQRRDLLMGYVIWNGKNSHGQPVPPGIYFLKADGKNVGKLVKVR